MSRNDKRRTTTQRRAPKGPTHCKHRVTTPVKGICAAYVRAGSPHPGVCDQHVKEER